MISKKSQKLKNKSGKSICDICRKPEILETHHINGRNIPDFDLPFNLCDICANCHNKVHYGMIVIEKWVMTFSGRELLWHKKEENSFTGEDAKPPMLI